MANILKRLSDEHEEVSKLIETLAEEDGDRKATFEELYRNLLAHAKAEEQEFYAHVRTLDAEISSKIEDAFQEHQEVMKHLKKMKSAIDDERFAAHLEELTDDFEHHVEEEEGELFPLVEQHMSEEELADLDEKYVEAKKAVMDSLLEDTDEYPRPTAEELYAGG